MPPGPALNACPAAPFAPAVRLHWRGGQLRRVSIQPVGAYRAMPAVNDAKLRDAPAVSRWQRLAAVLAAVTSRLRAASGRSRSVGRPLRIRIQGRGVPRWPATWPYTDGAPAWRQNSFLSDVGADRFAFAPDGIVDQSGRILRL
jgi:hypothetical protein